MNWSGRRYNRQNELLVDKGTVPLTQIFPAASWINATLVQHRTNVVKSKSLVQMSSPYAPSYPIQYSELPDLRESQKPAQQVEYRLFRGSYRYR